MFKRRLLPIFFLILSISIGLIAPILALPNSVEATTIAPQTLDSLTHSADAIVIATVTATHSQKGARFVTTDTTLQVEQVLKGSTGSTILLHQRGGRVGDFATIVPGMPYYKVGERVLVFLEAKPNHRYVTASLWLGKYTIHKDHGEEYVLVSPSFLPKNSSPTTHSDDDSPNVKNSQPIHEGHDSQSLAISLFDFTHDILLAVKGTQNLAK